MANITFKCSQCGQSLTIDDSASGMQVQCPSCSGSLRVPSAATAQVVVPAAAAQAPGTAAKVQIVSPGIEAAAPAAARSVTALRVFFVVALLLFLLPLVNVSSVSSNRESPLDLVLSLTNKTAANSYRNLKEVLLNGGDLAKQGDSVSLKAMLGVVVLWVTSLGIAGYCVLTVICAIPALHGHAPSSLMFKIDLACALQVIPLVLLGNSLIKSGTMAEGGGILEGASKAAVSPDWGAWILAAASLVILFWPKLSGCCKKCCE